MPKLIKLNDLPYPLHDPIIFSVDPGRGNFACRIEKRCDNGTIIPYLLMRIDFGHLIIQEVTKFLIDREELIKTIDVLLIERQMPINYSMVRLSQHIESYIMTKYPHVVVYEINPKVKPEKNICFEAAIEELEKGNDTKTIDFLIDMQNKKEKCDDLCDTIGQIKGFLSLIREGPNKIPIGPELGVTSKKKKSKTSKAPTKENKEFLSILKPQEEKKDKKSNKSKKEEVIDITKEVPDKEVKPKKSRPSNSKRKVGKVLPKATSDQLHNFLNQ